MNRVVLITGASRGLGLELAKKFIKTGDRVYGISRTRKYWAEALTEVPSKRFTLLCGDLTSEKKVKVLLAAIKRQARRIDILINNAGYCGPLSRVENVSSREMMKHLEENLMSAFLVSKYALPCMLKQKRARILNISSMAGTRAVPRLFPYSAAKFGVLALSQAIAKENPKPGFSCITVCPGGMNTEMRRELFGAEDAARQQLPDFVAEVIMKIIKEKIKVLSGGHIVIRHGKITGIFPPPAA